MGPEHITGTGTAVVDTLPAHAPSTPRALPDAAPAHVAAVKASAAPEAAPPDPATLKKSVEALNAFIQPHVANIEFSLDTDSGKTLLKIVDKETDTVLMQFPSKEALALSRSVGKLKGFLIKDTA